MYISLLCLTDMLFGLELVTMVAKDGKDRTRTIYQNIRDVHREIVEPLGGICSPCFAAGVVFFLGLVFPCPVR